MFKRISITNRQQGERRSRGRVDRLAPASIGLLVLSVSLGWATASGRAAAPAVDATPTVQQPEQASAAHGAQLFASWHCFYCHRIGTRGGRVGPALDGDLTRKRTHAFLLEHFKNPAAATPFARMPVIPASDTELEALARYIGSLQPGAATPVIALPALAIRGSGPTLAEGKALYEAANCRSCHALGGKGAAVGPALDREGATGRKTAWLLALFRDPDAVVPGTTMPVVQGTDRQLRSLARYLLSLQARITPTAALGRRIYTERNCAYCHGGAGKGTPFGPALAGKRGPVRNDVWVLEHFRAPAGVTPNTIMPRAAAADWEWEALLKYLTKLMGPRLGRAVASGGVTATGPPMPPPPGVPPPGMPPDIYPEGSRTVDDLKLAYQDETRTRDKYLVFAGGADEEGYRDAAQLFRAAALAEKIHARNHAAVLQHLGVKATAATYTGPRGTTPENLRDALQGETYARDVMYPAMIQRAREAEQSAAVRSLTYALKGEKQHAELFAGALARLKERLTATRYAVCPECGATFAGDLPLVCPTCHAEGTKVLLAR